MTKRLIEPAMVKWLDGKLRANGLAQHAIATRDARLVFRLAAEACVGIRESGGNNRGPLVELLQETIGRAEREAWCMAAVQTWLAYAEIKTRVISLIFPSEHCLTVWNETPRSQRVISEPLPGAICIWRHGRTTNGHTGPFLSWQNSDKTAMRMVEGNTESGIAGGKVERDGGGIYFTERARIGTGSMKVVGFLKPF